MMPSIQSNFTFITNCARCCPLLRQISKCCSTESEEIDKKVEEVALKSIDQNLTENVEVKKCLKEKKSEKR